MRLKTPISWCFPQVSKDKHIKKNSIFAKIVYAIMLGPTTSMNIYLLCIQIQALNGKIGNL